MAGIELRPVGLTEIAWLHDVKHQTAWAWSCRHILVAPDCVISGKPLWLDLGRVEVWSRQTGRYERSIARWSVYLLAYPRAPQVLTFATLYDLLELGQEKTRIEEIGIPRLG